MNLPRKPLPRMARAKQQLSSERVASPTQLLAEKLRAAGVQARIPPGGRIAITAGSRGFGGFVELLGGITEFVREAGGIPVIIPAMGSHGGATADGQRTLLQILGVNEKALGAEIVSSMEAASLGVSRSGAEAFIDRAALECNGIIVFGRVKTHPENTEGIASGLLKMTAVGLGKQVGAQAAHSHGLWEAVRAVPELTFATGKIIGGVAVVENACREAVAIEVVPGAYDAFRKVDEDLLLVSRKHFAKVPFEKLDVLIVDEMGKNISGTGMDLNVVGPWRIKGGEKKPDFSRIVVLSLTPESNGNALGVGLADFTTLRLQQSFDPQPTYVNLLTATEPDGRNTVEASFPAVLASDRKAIESAVYSCLKEKPRVCRIRNTSDLGEFWISEHLAGDIESDPALEMLGAMEEMKFDEQGNLF